MVGVLVQDQQSFPLEYPVVNSVFQNASTCSSQLEETGGIVTHEFTSHATILDPSWLNIPGFHRLDYFINSPPSFPSGKSNLSISNLHRNDELLPKCFSRSLSKLGEERVVPFEGYLSHSEFSRGDGLVSDDVDRNTKFNHVYGSDLSDFINGIPLPMAGVHGYSNDVTFVGSPINPDAISAQQKFLHSNNEDDAWPAVDAYSSDEFRMYDFKVRKCTRGRSHDWTECPFAHPGEKARRRDPRRFHYSGTACPDFRKGNCKRGDGCEYAHGVFECWLHPARYRTQPCKDGRNCRRSVCFFSHTIEQLRVLSGSQAASSSGLHSSALKGSLSGCYDGSPLRQALAGPFDNIVTLEGIGYDDLFGASDGHLGSPEGDQLSSLDKGTYGPACGFSQVSSPTSTLVGQSHSPPYFSPPLSPRGSPPCPSSTSYWSTQWTGSPFCLQGPLKQNSSHALQSSVQPVAPFAARRVNSGSLTDSTVASHVISLDVPGHRRYLDRTMPSVSVPVFESTNAGHVKSPGSMTCENVSSETMGDLIASIQQLHLTSREANSLCASSLSPRKSSVFHAPLSLPGTPKKCRFAGQTYTWDIDDFEAEPNVESVKSGRDLRAKIYGRLTKKNPPENESLDLDWVSELVK